LANITLVDDDENIVASVSLALESHGHKVTAWHDGASGLEALEASPPDLAILDVKMPRMDGMEVLRRLRQTSQIPVIMLTSKDEEIDEILGFNLGADDYIHKPSSGSRPCCAGRARTAASPSPRAKAPPRRSSAASCRWTRPATKAPGKASRSS